MKRKVLKSNSETKDYNKLMDIALRALSRRSYTEHDMLEKLSKFSSDLDLSNLVMDRLRELRYLNDELYVQRYLDLMQVLKPQSLRSVMYALQRKGISPDMVEKFWHEKDISNEALLDALYEKRKHRYDLSDPKSKQKFLRYFASKGFSSEAIFSLAKKLESM